MKVTIIADASHCHETGVGGFAFWVACRRGKRGSDGAFKVRPNSSTTAEAMALCNALHFAIRTGLVLEGDVVLLQSDCEQALRLFEGVRPPKNEHERKVKDLFLKLLAGKVTTEFRHVRGHSKEEGSRYVVNNICDRKARAHMRKARKKALWDKAIGELKTTLGN